MKNQVLTGDVKDEGFVHFFSWNGANNVASCKCGATCSNIRNAEQLKTWGYKHLAEVKNKIAPRKKLVKLRELTVEEAKAFVFMNQAEGRNWKVEIRRQWEQGFWDRNMPYSILYALRNSHGPSWLAWYTLDKAYAVIAKAEGRTP